MSIDAKFIGAVIKSIEDKSERILLAKISDELVDRDGEIIRLSAWDSKQLDEFIKNSGVLLLSHDYKSLPIGKILEFEKRSDGMYMRARLIKGTEAAEETWLVVNQVGKIGFSVGFIPRQSVELSVSHLAPREKESALRAGLSATDKVRVYTRVELLEVSLVSVPSLPSATLLAYKSNQLKNAELKKACAEILGLKTDIRNITPAELEKRIQSRLDTVVRERLVQLREKIKELDKQDQAKKAPAPPKKQETSLATTIKAKIAAAGVRLPEGDISGIIEHITKSAADVEARTQEDELRRATQIALNEFFKTKAGKAYLTETVDLQLKKLKGIVE